MKLTEQEQITLSAQLIQFASINLNALINTYESSEVLKKNVNYDILKNLRTEIKDDIEKVRNKMLNTLDNIDALDEDQELYNPILEILNKQN